jgi:hypothetical protein
MNESLMDYLKRKGEPDLPEDTVPCLICDQPMPAKALFCPHCGPPSRDDGSLDKDLTFFQAFLRITLIVLLFVVIASYKLDLPLDTVVDDIVHMVPGLEDDKIEVPKPEETPDDEDFRVVSLVKVNKANVRERAATDSKIVVVLKRGSEIKVLDAGDQWSQIEYQGKQGWILNNFLTSEIR